MIRDIARTLFVVLVGAQILLTLHNTSAIRDLAAREKFLDASLATYWHAHPLNAAPQDAIQPGWCFSPGGCSGPGSEAAQTPSKLDACQDGACDPTRPLFDHNGAPIASQAIWWCVDQRPDSCGWVSRWAGDGGPLPLGTATTHTTDADRATWAAQPK